MCVCVPCCRADPGDRSESSPGRGPHRSGRGSAAAGAAHGICVRLHVPAAGRRRGLPQCHGFKLLADGCCCCVAASPAAASSGQLPAPPAPVTATSQGAARPLGRDDPYRVEKATFDLSGHS